MAQTGYDVTPELDFAVVRMLSIEGALNPLIVLWSFPPYRRIFQILLCGRYSNGGEKKKQNEGRKSVLQLTLGGNNWRVVLIVIQSGFKADVNFGFIAKIGPQVYDAS